MRSLAIGACVGALLTIAVPAAAQGAASDQSEDAAPAVSQQAAATLASLHPQRGRIPIDSAHATLDLGNAYDFYGAADARKILVDVWGNPPASADKVLGIVMPAGTSPMSDSWGAVVTYEDSGFVSDSDAAEVNYAELMTKMKEGEAERNDQRKSQGYPPIHLAGWAEQPTYDAATHSVVWAQDLSFDDTPVHTLNYDVRTLGRHGVLSINFISAMGQLPAIRAAAKAFTQHAAFDTGSRYSDFDSSTDKEAEYGIGGLVAAGVGVAAAKKLGLLAILLKFLKPIAIAAIAGFAVLRNKIAALFGRKSVAGDDWAYEEEPAPSAPGPGERGDLSGGDRS